MTSALGARGEGVRAGAARRVISKPAEAYRSRLQGVPGLWNPRPAKNLPVSPGHRGLSDKAAARVRESGRTLASGLQAVKGVGAGGLRPRIPPACDIPHSGRALVGGGDVIER